LFFWGRVGGGAGELGLKILTFKPLGSQWVLIGMKKGYVREQVWRRVYFETKGIHTIAHIPRIPLSRMVSLFY